MNFHVLRNVNLIWNANLCIHTPANIHSHNQITMINCLMHVIRIDMCQIDAMKSFLVANIKHLINSWIYQAALHKMTYQIILIEFWIELNLFGCVNPRIFEREFVYAVYSIVVCDGSLLVLIISIALDILGKCFKMFMLLPFRWLEIS